jgi:methylated-DNA-protein-cysteine methyltransferase related protein
VTPFEVKVANVVRHIPRGRTLGYGQVALLAGAPGGARAVVRALNSLKGIPWWRVVRSDGTVAEAMMGKQAPKLRAEGVRLIGAHVDPERHGLGEKSGSQSKRPGRKT